MKRTSIALLALLMGGTNACGSLEANTDSAPALATVNGSIINPDSLAVPESIRIAVVWRSNEPGRFNVAEDLPVEPSLVSFRIALGGPPPQAAMNTETSGPPGTACAMAPDPTMQYAIGSVVAYEDVNRNGRLDLVANDAGAYVDRILATNETTSIVYIQGPLPVGHAAGCELPGETFGHAPKEGYNLLDLAPPCFPPGAVPGPTSNTLARPPARPATSTVPPFAPPGWGSSSACPASSVVDAGGPTLPVGTLCPNSEWLPISAPFVLAIATDPKLDSYMCATSGGSGAGISGDTTPHLDPSVQPASYPAPCDPNLACAPDGSQYFYGTCASAYRGLCEVPLVTCTAVGYSRPSPAPAAWPCP